VEADYDFLNFLNGYGDEFPSFHNEELFGNWDSVTTGDFENPVTCDTCPHLVKAAEIMGNQLAGPPLPFQTSHQEMPLEAWMTRVTELTQEPVHPLGLNQTPEQNNQLTVVPPASSPSQEPLSRTIATQAPSSSSAQSSQSQSQFRPSDIRAYFFTLPP
jgi:hypothetical protein